MRILILGAGGHAQVAADILFRMRDAGEEVLPIGFLDDDESLHGKTFLGLEVLGSISKVNEFQHNALFPAIGDNGQRSRVFAQLSAKDETFVSAIHPRAVLAPDVKPEPGCLICAGCVVNTGSAIMADSILNTGCTIDHHNKIGPHAHIAPGVNLGGEVEVAQGAFMGIGSCAAPRVRIGAWSVVGAGAAVVSDVPGNETWAGVPARKIKGA